MATHDVVGAPFTTMVQLKVPLLPAASVTVTVYVNDPLTVGVPEIVPLEAMLSPAGRPVALNVYGPPTPPLPTMVTGAIATPWTAVMAIQLAVGGAFTVTEQLKVPL